MQKRTRLSGNRRPCSFLSAPAAQYGNELDDAVLADRYSLLYAPAVSKLFLREGTYRLRARGVAGEPIDETAIQVLRAE